MALANSLTIVGRARKASQNLESSVAFLSESQKDICALSHELINEANDLTNLRKPYTGKHVRELDKFLEGVIKGFDAIHSEVQALIPKQDNLKGPLERAFNWGKRFYTVDSVKKKILYLLERVRDTQQKFLAKNSALTTLDSKDVRESAIQMKAGISLLVQTAESDTNEAKKIFGIDQMTVTQRKAALHKTALDVAVTANDENLLLMALKTRTLMSALASDLRGLEKYVVDEPKLAYEEKPQDPFHDANSDPCRAWRRHDALIETITFLDILRSPECLLATPAIVLLVRANRICRSLHSLGLQKEALQLCIMAHEALQDLSSSNPAFYHGYLADSVVTLLVCYGTGKKRDLPANEKLVKTYRALAKVKPELYAKHLANSLHDLSFRLGDVGRKDDAVAAIQESVTICRTLAKTNPDQFRPAVARSLIVLYKYLEETHKMDDALVAMEEAVAMYRVLAETNADAFTSDLAFALHHLSRALANMRKNDQALVAIQETVEIQRTLARTNPDVIKPKLVLSLDQMSVCFKAVGKGQEALIAVQEAVEVSRELASRDADAFNAQLARTLHILSCYLIDMENPEDAMTVRQEAVQTYQTLVKTKPGLFTSELALSLAHHSILLAKRDEAITVNQEPAGMYRAPANTNASSDGDSPGRVASPSKLPACLNGSGLSEETLSAIKETMETCGALVKTTPDAFIPDLAAALCDLSKLLFKLGQIALVVVQEAMDMGRMLATTNATAFSLKLATSLSGLFTCLRDAGQNNEALATIQEVVCINRILAKTNRNFNFLLQSSLINLYNCLSDAGKEEPVIIAVLQETVEVNRALANPGPCSNEFRSILAASLNNLSGYLKKTGDRTDALAASQEAVEIYRSLSETNGEAFDADLAMALTNLSVLLSDVGKKEEAIIASQKSVEMRRSLAKTNASAFDALLARSLNALSFRLREVGRREEALDAMLETVKIRSALAKANPTSHLTARDLANALNSLSYRLSDLGRWEEVLIAILELVESFRALAKRVPDTFNPELANCLDSLSVHLAGVGKTEEAVCASKEAVEMYRVLVDKDRDAFNPGYAKHLRNLAKHLTKTGESAVALTAAEESVDICKTLAKNHPEAFNRELALSLNVLSICQRAMGKRSEALALAEEAVAINRELVKTNPGGSNPELAESLQTVSICLRDSGRTRDSLAAIEESVEILGRLYDQHPEFFQSLLADALDVCLDCRQAAGKADETQDAEEEAGQIPD